MSVVRNVPDVLWACSARGVGADPSAVVFRDVAPDVDSGLVPLARLTWSDEVTSHGTGAEVAEHPQYVVEVQGIDGFPRYQFEEAMGVLGDVSAVLPYLTVARLLWENHPARLGLVSHERPGLSGRVLASPRARAVMESFLAPMFTPHEMGTNVSTGWFLPGANPDELGAQYLAPHSQSLGEPPVWRRYAVGVESVAEQIAWDDADRMREIVENVLTRPVDIVVTEAALTDREAYERGRDQHLQVQQTREGRELFSRPRDRVKPRIVATELRKVAEEWVRGAGSGWNSSHWRHATVSVDLASHSVFGYNRPSAMHAGVVLKLLPYWGRESAEVAAASTEMVTWAAPRVARALRQEKLGQVVIVTLPNGGGKQLVATKRPDLVECLFRAFDLPSGCTFAVVDPESAEA